MMSTNTIIFASVFVAAVVCFGWSCFRRFRLIKLGKPENRFDSISRRIRSMLFYPFTQRCTITRWYTFGINHAVLFWCFMLLLIANGEFLLHGLLPDYISLSRLPIGAHNALAMVFDVVSFFALLAAVVAMVRRLAFPPSYIEARSRDAFVILSLVAFLMVAYYGLHASEVARGVEKAAGYMPVSSLVASWFSGASAEALAVSAQVFWWIHAVVLLSFLNYLPYSKHMHILTSIPNCFFRNLSGVNIPHREQFKRGNTFGVGQVNEFTWKGLFDSYACTECGRCSDSCPATRTEKPLDPRLVIHDIKVNLLKNGPLISHGRKPNLPLIGGHHEGSVAEEALWACTTCGACVEVCPAFLEQYPRIIDMRRNLVEMQSKFPHELATFFENMEQRHNPWGVAPGERTKWTAETNVRIFDADKTEYLFFVGCVGAFDARSRRTTLAIARILSSAGISWGILGNDELCCGDGLRRLGNEFVFDRIANQNAKVFVEKRVKKVVTQCPHCYNILKNDYRQYGVQLEVVHYSELVNDLIQEGKLQLRGIEGLGNVVFHDSCYLGRYNAVYEAPRQVLTSVMGRRPIEMERNHNRSFCCGAGGGRMWLEESIGKHINVARVEQALAKDPNTICACCPYCVIMFEDALKDVNAEDRVQVLDLAEIVARTLPS